MVSSSPMAAAGRSSDRDTAYYVQATATLKDACQNLQHGQMVHVPHLTFMDAMGAIQVLDPRMDGGMQPISVEMTAECDRLPNGEVRPQFDPSAPLTCEDCLWIMDRFMACECAWLESASMSGASLSQTVYTCLYMHLLTSRHSNTPLPPIVEAVLRPFLVASLKCVDLVWQEMTKGNLMDGEDFSGDKAGVSLLEDISVQSTFSMLDDAIVELERGNVKGVPIELRRAVCDRLKFRRCLWNGIFLASQMDSTVLEQIRDALHQSTLHLDNIVIGSSNVSDAPSQSSRSAFDPWFSRNALASIVSNAYAPMSLPPPQPLSLPSEQRTRAIYQDIIAGMHDFVHLASTHMGWKEWKSFFDERAIHFQHQQSPPYVRSLWQSAICADNSVTGLSRPLSYIAESFLLDVTGVELGPIHSTSEENVMLLERRLSYFNERLAGQLVAYLRNQAQNRSRSKRRLADAHADLLDLGDEAAALGVDLNRFGVYAFPPNMLCTAVQTLTLETSLQCIFAGLEVQLYQQDELRTVYWMAHKAAEELENIWNDLVEWTQEKKNVNIPISTVRYVRTQAAWFSIVNRASLAFAHLFDGQRTSAKSLAWLSAQDHGDGNVLVDTQRAMFRKRFKWLHTKRRPESSNHLDDLWNIYSADSALLDRLGEQRSIKASDLFRQASEMCASSHVGLDDLASSFDRLTTMKISSLSLSFGSHQAHPWFPALSE